MPGVLQAKGSLEVGIPAVHECRGHVCVCVAFLPAGLGCGFPAQASSRHSGRSLLCPAHPAGRRCLASDSQTCSQDTPLLL